MPKKVLHPNPSNTPHQRAIRQQADDESKARLALFKEIERWRELLARNLALQNLGLAGTDLNDAVGKTIDRLIFLRLCEDRGVETFGRLRVLLGGPKVYDRLLTIFRSAEDRYKSGLFHFQQQKALPLSPDHLTPNLIIDDDILKDIIRELYPPDCPCEFSALPVDILGQIYEQSLGKIIRLTNERQAVVDERKGIKKKSGVYYTPTTIVDYILKHTVGKLLEGRTVKWNTREKSKPANQLRLDEPLRILDPACGSGAFLLGAYDFLLRWHLDYYTARKPQSWATQPNPPIRQCANPESTTVNRQSSYCLSIAERKRILLDHIYGVDLDAQAVEVTKLSLLLKALDGESQLAFDDPHRMCHERMSLEPLSHQRALPDLGSNIQCGNSLLGPDYLDNPRMRGCDKDGRDRINAFDWQAEFPQVFDDRPKGNRGVMTTPEDTPVACALGSDPSPDARSPSLDCRAPDPRSPTLPPFSGFDAVIGNPPYLSYSGRQAVELSEEERAYYAKHYHADGWMTSHGLFIEHAVANLSKRFVAFIVPDQVGHLDGYRATRETVRGHAGLVEVRYWGETVFQGVVSPTLTFVTDREHHGETRILHSDNAQTRCIRCEAGDAWVAPSMEHLLSKLREHTFSLGALVADPGVHTGNCSKKLVLPIKHSTPGCVPVLEGKQVFAYHCRRPSKVLRLDYQPEQGEYFSIRKRDRYAGAPFLIRQTAPHPIVGPREHADHFRNSLLALYAPRDGTDVRYLVGLLNSRLIRWVYSRSVLESRQKAFPQVKVGSLRNLPIHKIDLDIPKDKLWHDRIVKRVRKMLDLHRKLAAAKTPTDKASVDRRINETNKQIDGFVYALYGLTDEEIRLIEEATER